MQDTMRTEVAKLTCSPNLTNVQTVLLWADVDPAARATHVKQLCDHIPAARMLSVRHHDDLLQLPCTPAVKAAMARWMEENQQESTAVFTADDSSCMPADVTRQQAYAQGHLLVAGGHDVTWQSLRSVSMLMYVTILHGAPCDHKQHRCCLRHFLASFMLYFRLVHVVCLLLMACRLFLLADNNDQDCGAARFSAFTRCLLVETCPMPYPIMHLPFDVHACWRISACTCTPFCCFSSSALPDVSLTIS